MYRIYLLPEWREFGTNYPTRMRADAAVARYQKSFPHRQYRVRLCLPPTSFRKCGVNDRHRDTRRDRS